MRQQLSEVHTGNTNGHPILVFPCVTKVIRTMKTTRDAQRERVALYTALANYTERLFLEKDKTHYVSKRWWRAILIGYPKVSAAALLLLTIYFIFRTNPEYDFTVLKILLALPVAYIVFIILMGDIVFENQYKSRSLKDAPFYLRAYFLHSAIAFAYLRCLNSLLTLRDLEEGRVNKEKRKLLRKSVRAPFWPTDIKRPWELRMPKPTLWQKVKKVFYKIVDSNAPLPLRWSEEEVLNDYRRLPAQDKIYLINSLRHVISLFNTDYFEIPRKEIFSMDTRAFTEEKYCDRMLCKLYGPFGKGVLSISDYFSLFPDIEHAYAAFYHVLQRTWDKLPIRDICAGHSVVMALLILTEGSYHPEKVSI
jgi:uncharacterized membrane protein SirB2